LHEDQSKTGFRDKKKHLICLTLLFFKRKRKMKTGCIERAVAAVGNVKKKVEGKFGKENVNFKII